MKLLYNHLSGALFAGILAVTAVETANAGPLSVSGDFAAQSQNRLEYRYDQALGAGTGNAAGNTYRYRHRERSQWSGRSMNSRSGTSGWSREAGSGISGGKRGRR